MGMIVKRQPSVTQGLRNVKFKAARLWHAQDVAGCSDFDTANSMSDCRKWLLVEEQGNISCRYCNPNNSKGLAGHDASSISGTMEDGFLNLGSR
jgi:hypothetical protein